GHDRRRADGVSGSIQGGVAADCDGRDDRGVDQGLRRVRRSPEESTIDGTANGGDSMAIFQHLRRPTFGGATGWLNSEPLGPEELRGHVVLADFWTLPCINWLRPEPYVRAWSRAYRDDGLIVVGVHTPEFSFEHERDRVELAVKEMDIDYPVALDND